MPGTILRNTTGPFISLPFQTPPGHSLALSLAGTTFSATLEATLDVDSTDWVQIGLVFTTTTLYNATVGPVKYRLNLASGTVASAQYSTSLVQVVQTTLGGTASPDYSASITTAQSTANSAQGGATIAQSNALTALRGTGGALTPEQYGAVGDGTTDDKQAIWDMCAAYRAGTGTRMLLSRPYRIGRGTTAAHTAGAIEFIGLARVHIEFVGKGEIIMDNLAAGGAGDQYSGIYAAGPADHIEIINPRIRWATKPSGRSQGYGIAIKGFPDETNAKYIKRAIIRNPEVKWSPQGGVIMLGVSDPLVENARLTETLADGLHFNCCRRPRSIGVVSATTIGDDALAFVTYYRAVTGPLDTTEGYDPTGPYTPFGTSAVGEWNNGGGYADGSFRVGGTGNACRINGAFNLTVNTVMAKDANNGLAMDTAKRNGSTIMWSVAASRGVRVGNVITENCLSSLGSGLNGIVRTDGSLYYDFEVEIGSIQDRGGPAGNAVQISGGDGFRLVSVKTDRDVLVNVQSHGTRIERVSAVHVKLDSTVDTNLGTVDAQDVTLLGANDTRGNIWTLTNAQNDALSLLNDTVSLRVNQLNINYANRSATTFGRAVLVARGHDIQIGRLSVVHDNGPLRSFEIGGGDAGGVSDRIDFGQVVFQHQQASNTGSFSVQTGPYAAAKVKYNLRGSNDNGLTWLEFSGNTYVNTKVLLSDGDRVIAWGDSRTEGPDLVSGFVAQLPALIGRPVLNMGIAGQTSAQIAARSGTAPLSGIRTTSRIIPGNGTPSPLDVLTNADLLLSGVTRTLSGTVGGTKVLLSRVVPGGAYDVRQQPPTGTDAPLTVTTDFIPDNLTRAYIHIIWMGRNDDLINGIAALKANIANMVARVFFPSRYFVIGELNSQTEPNGNATCESIKTYNSQQAVTYGAFFLDPRSVLCVQDDGATARTDGTPNPNYMTDAIHPNAIGHARLARALAAKFTANNW